MKDLKTYIESGILEAYLLGSLSVAENEEVENMIRIHPEIRDEIEAVSLSLEQYSAANAIEPDPSIKPFLMSSIDFINRMKSGEKPSFPPMLNENSKIEDYSEWLDREDMVVTGELENMYAKIIGNSQGLMTAILWVKHNTPEEIHTDEFEKFLIVEGTCDIRIGNKVYHMKPGDYMAIPLHENHFVTVTSAVPCKAILQRVAA